MVKTKNDKCDLFEPTVLSDTVPIILQLSAHTCRHHKTQRWMKPNWGTMRLRSADIRIQLFWLDESLQISWFDFLIQTFELEESDHIQLDAGLPNGSMMSHGMHGCSFTSQGRKWCKCTVGQSHFHRGSGTPGNHGVPLLGTATGRAVGVQHFSSLRFNNGQGQYPIPLQYWNSGEISMKAITVTPQVLLRVFFRIPQSTTAASEIHKENCTFLRAGGCPAERKMFENRMRGTEIIWVILVVIFAPIVVSWTTHWPFLHSPFRWGFHLLV